MASLGLAAPQFNAPMVPNPSVPLPSLDHSRSTEEEPYLTREMQARQLRRLREEHQKQIFSDTERLLQLANQLKVEVHRSETPTTDALRDVDEIGRLAKRVSERIKTQ